MPHMQASKDGKDPSQEKDSSGEPSMEEDVEENKLLSLAATASKHAPPADAPKEMQPAAATAAAAPTDNQSKVTPSPYGAVQSRGYEPPPYYGYEDHPPPRPYPVYDHSQVLHGTGGRQLFPSPIRYSRSKSDEGDEGSSSRPKADHSPSRNGGHMLYAPPPSHLRHPSPYGPPSMHPYPPYPPHHYGYDHQVSQRQDAPPSSGNKRSHPPREEENSPKRWRHAKEDQQNLDIEGEDASNAEESSHAAEVLSHASTGESEGKTRKQRVISPSSSVEHTTGKSHDDESTGGTREIRIGTQSNHGSEAATQQQSGPVHFPPHPAPSDPRYGSVLSYQPRYYAPRPGMYGYPPPPPPYADGPPPHGWRMPPSGGFPPPHGGPHAPYPSPYPPRGYRHPAMPPRSYPPRGIDTEKGVDEMSAPPKSNSPQNTGAPKIKSVAEWQRATLATGKAPSANRCMPLKAPIPSRYWGEAEKAKGAPIPDFHQLVNFPDYLNKMRPNGSDEPSSADNDGKRPCVMCGKHRICSASTANLGGNALRRSKKPEPEEGDDADNNHIIPRQNKGLCTACDVTVWVYVESGLEIKWCKGCKNFRPWAAFGDKGLATKCVRCRDRQREKYANQKDELRQRRLRMSGKQDNKVGNGQHEIAAAKGLRDLMTASAAI